jgi:glycosyltransferase involved in cell wall biosynthesis
LLGDETLGEKQEYARELQELTTKLGLEERIHFRGFYENVAHGYAAMDCFVLSSLSETYGMVTIEAMAAGVPVIGTDSAGTPDILTSGRTGLLVPPRDPQALANALTKLMSNPELRAQLAAAAQKDAFERFSHHLQCSRIEELIERIHGN